MFKLAGAFLLSVNFARAPEMQELPDLQIESQTKYIIEEPSRFHLFLRMKTVSPEDTFSFSIELVGVFELVSGQEGALSRSEILEFVNDRGLFMLWPYAAQYVTLTTSLMGMSPINLHTPYRYNYVPPEETPMEDETDANAPTE